MNLDPRLTFDSFVVGPANRLAAAAARRTADTPGRSYNPLFVYSASGLGKSHILSAIAHRAERQHGGDGVIYTPLETYLGELTSALERGERSRLEDRYARVKVLLLDDVQFLEGQGQAQEMLLRTLDAITAAGGQVVLASDRPPSEIDGLDSRLLSRFSGGLIVDMGVPDLETRVAIIRKKAAQRDAFLGPGVAESLARFPFRNVRELQGALNRILAVQELEERVVEPSELPGMVRQLARGDDAPPSQRAPRPRAGEPQWRRDVRRAAEALEDEGFLARRLRRLLEDQEEPDDWEAVIRAVRADAERAQGIRRELDELGNPWPEAAATLLRDPDRLEEAVALLASARERARPFDPPPPGPALDDLEEHFPALALRAADRLLSTERPDYNPLFAHSPDSERARVFLESVGRTYLRVNPAARVGFTSVAEFAEEFIRAISDGVAGAWRERWWTLEVLLLHGLEELAQTERVQEEFFHLFEALRRRDARIFLASDRLPSEIETVDDRLRSRFEGGLVVELDEGPLPGAFLAPQAVPAEATDEAAGPAPEPATRERAQAPPTQASAAQASPTQASAAPEPRPAAGPDALSEAELDQVVEALEAEQAVPLEGGVAGTVADAGLAGDAAPPDELAALKELVGVGRTRKTPEAGPGTPGSEAGAADDEAEPLEAGPWVPSPERVVWRWPSDADRVLEDFS